MPNPFKPTAGATPPVLVGRESILEEFQESIEDGPGAPGLLQLISGARGIGKTVMLTELGDVALSNGWVLIHETAGPDMLDRIRRQARSARKELGSPGRTPGSTSWKLKMPLLEIGRKTENDSAHGIPTWFEEIEALFEVLEPHQTGICITVDEIHSLSPQPLHELATQMQMFIRRDRPVALIMAGLPGAIDELLAGRDKPTTFLRRAERPEMRDVSVTEVARAFQQTIAEAGRAIEDDLAQLCAEATGGYPFMIQLVGYHVWRQGRTGEVRPEHVRAGIGAAQVRIGNLVHAPALKDLSGVDRSFLVHMAADEGSSRVSDIGTRMKRDANYVNHYRGRLIAAGMIYSSGFGLVDFEMPFMREYLRQHATHLLAGKI